MLTITAAGLPRRTIHVCIRCQQNPAGFWVGLRGAAVVRRPWCRARLRGGRPRAAYQRYAVSEYRRSG
jgi:hypothetical protein